MNDYSPVPIPGFYEPKKEPIKPQGKTPPEATDRAPEVKPNLIAYDGAVLNTNELPDIKPLPKYKDMNINIGKVDANQYVQEVDSYTVEDINRKIDEARINIIQATNLMHQASRKVNETKMAYSAAQSRAILKTSGATESIRKAAADIQVEEQYGEYLVAQQAESYLKSLLQGLRSNLDALTQISHNIRAQINII